MVTAQSKNQPEKPTGNKLRAVRALAILAALAISCAHVYQDLGRQTARESLDAALAAADNAGLDSVQVVEPWLSGCGRNCNGGYFDFIARHSRKPKVKSRHKVRTEIALTESFVRPEPLGLDAANLADRIRSGLAIDRLLDGIDQRQLLVATLEESTRDGIAQRRLLIGDPEVGSFKALLLMQPDESGAVVNRPAVLGLHGHKDSAKSFAEEYLGRELARQGFVVLIPELRFHNCGVSETNMAFKLLERGSTLLGLKVYESLLMARLLGSLEEVDGSRIGLLAHSGGGSIAEAAVRISDAFAAKVVDLKIEFRDQCGPLGVHCQTVPALAPLAADLKRDRDLPIPALTVPYRFEAPAVRAQIQSFFEAALALDQNDSDSVDLN
jgi:hypothetical protein